MNLFIRKTSTETLLTFLYSSHVPVHNRSQEKTSNKRSRSRLLDDDEEQPKGIVLLL